LRDAWNALSRDFHFDDSGSTNTIIFYHSENRVLDVLDDDCRPRESFELHCAVGHTIVVTKDPLMQSVDSADY
jgi:hypothetical protein